MPIEIRDFEKGEAPDPGESEDSFEAKAQKFLDAHRDKAYTLEEIVRATGLLTDDPKSVTAYHEQYGRFHSKLEFMTHQGRIRQNDVRRGKYVDVFWAGK
jgi:hypothetical protein